MVKKTPPNPPKDKPANCSPSSPRGTRLNKFLSQCGLGSRRHCEEYISDGRIKINGKVVSEFAAFVSPEDEVRLDGSLLKNREIVYLLLNKPKNMITSMTDPDKRLTVGDLFRDFPSVKPVGRLDRNSTGVLLLTNDGELHYRLTHPRYQIPRIYKVYLDNKPKANHLGRLERGITLDDGKTARAKVVETQDNMLILELREGLNREIRRMFEILGYQVKSLDRLSYGGVGCGQLMQGKFRHLQEKEVRQLKKLCGL